MIPKQEKLIDDLIEKTESSDIQWEPTDAESQFALKLKRGVILLERSPNFFGGDDFVITILNSEGKQIDRIEVSDAYCPIVGNLFQRIDRRINRIDEQIDEIIGELETL